MRVPDGVPYKKPTGKKGILTLLASHRKKILEFSKNLCGYGESCYKPINALKKAQGKQNGAKPGLKRPKVGSTGEEKRSYGVHQQSECRFATDLKL